MTVQEVGLNAVAIQSKGSTFTKTSDEDDYCAHGNVGGPVPRTVKIRSGARLDLDKLVQGF